MNSSIMTKRITEYKLINATSYAALEKGMADAIAEGYTPYGDISLAIVSVRDAIQIKLVQPVVKCKRGVWGRVLLKLRGETNETSK